MSEDTIPVNLPQVGNVQCDVCGAPGGIHKGTCPATWPVSFEDLCSGDFVKVRVGNERLWFKVLAHVDSPSNAIMCILQSEPVSPLIFDGRVTIDRDWIIETQCAPRAPSLKLVKP